jgi:hypothetical protein
MKHIVLDTNIFVIILSQHSYTSLGNCPALVGILPATLLYPSCFLRWLLRHASPLQTRTAQYIRRLSSGGTSSTLIASKKISSVTGVVQSPRFAIGKW